MAADIITHKGRITAIDPDVTTVEIIAESACSSCHAKMLCSVSEMQTKTVLVRTSAWSPHNIGDEVEVALRKALGYKAVFIAYGLPLVVLFVCIMILPFLGVNELWTGIGALCAVAVCYLFIYLFRNKLGKEYAFYIK